LHTVKRAIPDREKTTALARQVGIDFGAALTVALAYIGDHLGIFHSMASGEPFTSQQLAERTGLNERYLREWASTMAAAGYLEYQAGDKTFRMNPEQSLVLTDQHSVFFSAGSFQYAVGCYAQISRLMNAFKEGGGVPFADFGKDIVEGIERLFQPGYEAWVAREWIPAVPELHQQLLGGADVAEVGCGAGQCIVPLALAYPRSRFVGCDIDPSSIERAKNKASNAGVEGRVSFELVAAEALPVNRFDLTMAFNCIHDMAHPKDALRGIRKALKPGGFMLWSEADASDQLEENIGVRGRTLYGASTMHCMTVSLASGGEGLGVVVGENRMREMARGAGFSTVARLPVKNPYHQILVLRT
jgi:2-polyprenyl-3-methyl-5-hydroxy-6-metoxy-1,4-benzoquinol methylase